MLEICETAFYDGRQPRRCGQKSPISKPIDWGEYCANAAAWLQRAKARLAAREAEHKRWREREEARIWREARETARQMVAEERLLASGYGPIDDLEDEVVLVDLEFTDAETILAVDCQTFHLERLTP